MLHWPGGLFASKSSISYDGFKFFKEVDRRGEQGMVWRIRLPKWSNVTLIVAILLFFLPSDSFSGGGQHYPNGSTAFLLGVAPPPGFYLEEYNYWYTASKLKDNSGHTLSLEKHGAELDRLSVYGVIPRFVWISKFNFLGGFYGQHLFVPLLKVDMNLDVLTPGGPIDQNDHRTGVGDLIYSPLIWTWHAENGLFHMIGALDIYFPTGSYHKDHLVNIGKNFWTFEPVFAFTGFLPGHTNLSASVKMMYDFNTKNDDIIIGPSTAAKIGNMSLAGLETHLTPGQEFHFDYTLEYAITKDFRAGVTGYFYQQTTNDKTGLGEVKHDKGRVFAIGPGVWYNHKKWFFKLYGAFETEAKNRPEGVSALLVITYAF